VLNGGPYLRGHIIVVIFNKASGVVKIISIQMLLMYTINIAFHSERGLLCEYRFLCQSEIFAVSYESVAG